MHVQMNTIAPQPKVRRAAQVTERLTSWVDESARYFLIAPAVLIVLLLFPKIALWLPHVVR